MVAKHILFLGIAYVRCICSFFLSNPGCNTGEMPVFYAFCGPVVLMYVRDNLLVQSKELITKLCKAGAVELRSGQPSFSLGFQLYIMKCLGDRDIRLTTISSLRNVFGQYDPSLARLDIEEMADLMALLLFSFQSGAQRILAELRNSKPLDQETT